MFFSANPSGAFAERDELVRLVLNREHRLLPPRVRIYTALHASDISRQSGVTTMMEIGGVPKVYSEIVFPPFTYVLSLDSDPPDERLIDITFFAHFRYNDWRDIPLWLPVLPVYTPFPGDYRSRDQTKAEFQANIESMNKRMTP